MAKVGIGDDCKEKANYNNEDECKWANINAIVENCGGVLGNQDGGDSY